MEECEVSPVGIGDDVHPPRYGREAQQRFASSARAIISNCSRQDAGQRFSA